ncbi:hypothetical protein BEH94_07090 [Candidatus Altiarchaeales archaeon WOR_SM1_SCG]|nr:hypothetical protein BEH94_07090 [Candidatus Altiarchaeales archaeon WOR_SM1_SCG]
MSAMDITERFRKLIEIENIEYRGIQVAVLLFIILYFVGYFIPKIHEIVFEEGFYILTAMCLIFLIQILLEQKKDIEQIKNSEVRINKYSSGEMNIGNYSKFLECLKDKDIKINEAIHTYTIGHGQHLNVKRRYVGEYNGKNHLSSIKAYAIGDYEATLKHLHFKAFDTRNDINLENITPVVDKKPSKVKILDISFVSPINSGGSFDITIKYYWPSAMKPESDILLFPFSIFDEVGEAKIFIIFKGKEYHPTTYKMSEHYTDKIEEPVDMNYGNRKLTNKYGGLEFNEEEDMVLIYKIEKPRHDYTFEYSSPKKWW